MQLTQVVKGIKCEIKGKEKDILTIEHDSKNVNKGALFVCLSGKTTSGELYVAEAIQNGAVAIMVDKTCSKQLIKEHVDKCTFIIVNTPIRESFALACKNLYYANRTIPKIIGVTGTNGKTTISFMIANGLIVAGYSVGIIGTSGIFVNGEQIRGEGLTTPDPAELYQTLAFFDDIFVDYVVMEVSAHALYLDKLCGLNFEYGIFTNLTEDHLDYFVDMENYGKAKAKFFSMVDKAIFNIDDEFGTKLYDQFVGYKKSVSLYSGDYIYENKNNKTIIHYENKKIMLQSYLKGVYNSTNTTEAFAVLTEIIKDNKKIKLAFKNLQKIDGRYNEFVSKNHGLVILDFAHTPDGLEKILTSARTLVKGNGVLFSVFGCGGNRDKEKRHIMGEVAGRLADYTFISIDNPRFEDEKIVMADVESGIKKLTNNYTIVMPRSVAILKAYLSSSKNDVIVVSGKGTEPYYEVMGEKRLYREDLVIKSIIDKFDRKGN